MILKQAEAKWSLSNQITRQNLYLGGNGSDRKSGSHIWRGMNPSEMFCRLMAIDQSDPAPLFHLFADIGSGHHSHSQLPYVHHPSLLCIEDLRERNPESNLCLCQNVIVKKSLSKKAHQGWFQEGNQKSPERRYCYLHFEKSWHHFS